jgi:hypothetical protein
MLHVTIKGHSVNLSKEEILARLPESLLAEALQCDPDLKELHITQPEVDSEALNAIANHLEGIEPKAPLPSFVQADRYLNLPSLLPYSSPGVFQIPNRNNLNSRENKAYLEQVIKENQTLTIRYALQHGWRVRQDDFLTAVAFQATDVVKEMLKYHHPGKDDDIAIRMAASRGYTEIVKLLLTDERVDPTACDNYALRYAASDGHIEVVRVLLVDGRSDPAAEDNWAFRIAAANGRLEIVRMLLADPRVDPTVDNKIALRWAEMNGQLEVVQLLQADPRFK